MNGYWHALQNLERLQEALNRVTWVSPIFRRLRMWESLIQTAEKVVAREEEKRDRIQRNEFGSTDRDAKHLGRRSDKQPTFDLGGRK